MTLQLVDFNKSFVAILKCENDEMAHKNVDTIISSMVVMVNKMDHNLQRQIQDPQTPGYVEQFCEMLRTAFSKEGEFKLRCYTIKELKKVFGFDTLDVTVKAMGIDLAEDQDASLKKVLVAVKKWIETNTSPSNSDPLVAQNDGTKPNKGLIEDISGQEKGAGIAREAEEEYPVC